MISKKHSYRDFWLVLIMVYSIILAMFALDKVFNLDLIKTKTELKIDMEIEVYLQGNKSESAKAYNRLVNQWHDLAIPRLIIKMKNVNNEKSIRISDVLRKITKQKYGNFPDLWEKWWNKNKETF